MRLPGVNDAQLLFRSSPGVRGDRADLGCEAVVIEGCQLVAGEQIPFLTSVQQTDAPGNGTCGARVVPVIITG